MWNTQDWLLKTFPPFMSQVMVAAKTVALSSPTPTPVKTAWVASVLVMLLQNALLKASIDIKILLNNQTSAYGNDNQSILVTCRIFGIAYNLRWHFPGIHEAKIHSTGKVYREHWKCLIYETRFLGKLTLNTCAADEVDQDFRCDIGCNFREPISWLTKFCLKVDP